MAASLNYNAALPFVPWVTQSRVDKYDRSRSSSMGHEPTFAGHSTGTRVRCIHLKRRTRTIVSTSG